MGETVELAETEVEVATPTLVVSDTGIVEDAAAVLEVVLPVSGAWQDRAVQYEESR